jgi:hypothetical protein
MRADRTVSSARVCGFGADTIVFEDAACSQAG